MSFIRPFPFSYFPTFLRGPCCVRHPVEQAVGGIASRRGRAAADAVGGPMSAAAHPTTIAPHPAPAGPEGRSLIVEDATPTPRGHRPGAADMPTSVVANLAGRGWTVLLGLIAV